MMKKETLPEVAELYNIICKAIPADTSVVVVLRACELVLADAIAQSEPPAHVREKTYIAIDDNIRTLCEELIKAKEEIEL